MLRISSPAVQSSSGIALRHSSYHGEAEESQDGEASAGNDSSATSSVALLRDRGIDLHGRLLRPDPSGSMNGDRKARLPRSAAALEDVAALIEQGFSPGEAMASGMPRAAARDASLPALARRRTDDPALPTSCPPPRPVPELADAGGHNPLHRGRIAPRVDEAAIAASARKLFSDLSLTAVCFAGYHTSIPAFDPVPGQQLDSSLRGVSPLPPPDEARRTPHTLVCALLLISVPGGMTMRPFGFGGRKRWHAFVQGHGSVRVQEAAQDGPGPCRMVVTVLPFVFIAWNPGPDVQRLLPGSDLGHGGMVPGRQRGNGTLSSGRER